jgi:hypothetical protein
MFIFSPRFLIVTITMQTIIYFCLSTQSKGQSKETADTVKTDTYQFINETNVKHQAKKFGFDTNSEHQSCTISVDDKIFQALYPPKLISPANFQFMTYGSYDSAIVFTSSLNSLNWIELQPKNNFRIKTFSDLFVLSLISSAALATISEEHVGYVLLNSCAAGMKAFPLLALGGIFSFAGPEKFRYAKQDYFQSLNKWNFGAGLSLGYWPLITYNNSPYPNSSTVKGLYFNLKRRYSPFSLAFRLYHLPLPNKQQLYWNDFESVSNSNNFELHFNPAVKTMVYSNKLFNLNVLTGFLTQLRFLSKGTYYPYEDDYALWGVVETELQCHISKNLSMNFSAASHYNFENSRFPLYAGLMYAETHSSERSLNLEKINIMPFVHFINTNLDAEHHNSFFGDPNEKKIYKPVYGLGLSMNIGRLTELSYLLSVDLGDNFSNIYTRVSHSMKFAGYLPILNRLYMGMSVAISVGDIYGFAFEVIPGFNIQFNLMNNLAVFGSYENGFIDENHSPSFYGIGFKYHL